MGPLGSLIYGARTQHETADIFVDQLRADTAACVPRCARAGHEFGVRAVAIADRRPADRHHRAVASMTWSSRPFETWRATAAYKIAETGTKLHASAGTGAKAPTLFQLYLRQRNAILSPEESFGYDAGIDQSLFNGRVIVSLTGFSNKFSNLIDFVSRRRRRQSVRTPGCYFNVSRAETNGLEVGTTIDVLPGLVKFNDGLYLSARERSRDRPDAGAAAEKPGAFRAHHHADRQVADRAPRPHGFEALQQRRPDQPARRLYPRRPLHRVQDRQELESVRARRKHLQRALSGSLQLRHHRSCRVCGFNATW